ncbi:MAG: response regulator [Anaerolineae bacterium]|jgi:DNA-binding response OmpR family regulator
MERTILLIEDDPLSARLVDLILKSEGHQVIITRDGFEGLEVAKNTSLDLVLLDLMLPKMDGFEVLRQLRADPKTADVRVVIVSAKSQPADKERAAELGVNAYLTKPYRKVELLELVRSLLSES